MIGRLETVADARELMAPFVEHHRKDAVEACLDGDGGAILRQGHGFRKRKPVKRRTAQLGGWRRRSISSDAFGAVAR